MRTATSPATWRTVPGEASHLRDVVQMQSASPAVPPQSACITCAGQPTWIAVYVECLAAMAMAIGGHSR